MDDMDVTDIMDCMHGVDSMDKIIFLAKKRASAVPDPDLKPYCVAQMRFSAPAAFKRYKCSHLDRTCSVSCYIGLLEFDCIDDLVDLIGRF